MTDIKAIADGLTYHQRRSILEAKDLFSLHDGYPFFTVRKTGEPWPQGVAQFLTLNSDRLTRLGLSVRAYLKEQSHDAD